LTFSYSPLGVFYSHPLLGNYGYVTREREGTVHSRGLLHTLLFGSSNLNKVTQHFYSTVLPSSVRLVIAVDVV
jgi:hypothetical protein